MFIRLTTKKYNENVEQTHFEIRRPRSCSSPAPTRGDYEPTLESFSSFTIHLNDQIRPVLGTKLILAWKALPTKPGVNIIVTAKG